MKKKKKTVYGIFALIGAAFMILTGCSGYGPYSSSEMAQTENTDETVQPVQNITETDETTGTDAITETKAEDDSEVVQPVPYESEEEPNAGEEGESDNASDDTTDQSDEEYLPGYATESDFRSRHTGSASVITDKTLIVSIFIDEEEDVWTQSEKEHVLGVCDIAYSFLDEYLEENYDADIELIYDWEENQDLSYSIRIFENIPAYVTTEQEHHMDDLEDEWVAQIPVRDLMIKYETDSIAFLYFVPHEGCSYSSMHFVEDGEETWNEGCLLYLNDMYSPTYEYETPTVFAHELLHLFGAEDFYESADVFSAQTYSSLAQKCPEDIMLKQFDMINGVYTTYPDRVKGEISPATAYLLGLYDESAVEDIQELIREETGVFPGSTYDRPF